MDLTHRHLLTLLDFTPGRNSALAGSFAHLETRKSGGHRASRPRRKKHCSVVRKRLDLEPAARSEVAAFDLGMQVTYLGPTGSQMGKKESIRDTARVLGRMYDGIEYRGYKQSTVETLAKESGVPVWNGLTDQFHPTQILADFLTILEHKNRLGRHQTRLSWRRSEQHGQ
ncbi:MAG: hypothetical protein MZU97_03540 [Bacillus subtilis]|nr:hypothetical protein [Bacillus subtilis]